MIEQDVKKEIDEFLSSVQKLLPASFEAEDLLDELRSHIIDSLKEKIQKNPTVDQRVLLRDVLEEVGEPQEIAEEFSRAHLTEGKESSKFDFRRAVFRLVIATIVWVIIAWGVSIMTKGSLDFLTVLTVFIVFTIFETIIRSWQTGRGRIGD